MIESIAALRRSISGSLSQELTVPIISGPLGIPLLTTHEQRIVVMSHNIIARAQSRTLDRVTNPGYKESHKKLPYYYRIMWEQVRQSHAQGLFMPQGIPCHACQDVILEGTNALSVSGHTRRKYFCIPCAERLHLI